MPISAAPDPAGFAAWYASYRRKDARADAVKAWRQLNPDAALQARMLAAVDAWRWSDRRELNPLPASWLRGKRWEDESVSTALGQGAAFTPQWCVEAGFANAFEAANEGCKAHNAHQFRDGKRIKETT